MTRIVRWFSTWRDRLALRRSVRRLRRLERAGIRVYATALAGKFGKVVVGATTVAELDEWTYTPTTDLIEKTPFLATSKTHIAGLNDGTGTFKGRHDMTDTLGQVALRNAQLAGTQVTLKLYTTGANFYTVPAFIKSHPMKAPVSGLVDIQFDFQQDGDATYS